MKWKSSCDLLILRHQLRFVSDVLNVLNVSARITKAWDCSFVLSHVWRAVRELYQQKIRQ